MSRSHSSSATSSEQSTIQLRTAYDGLSAYYSDLTGLSCPEPTLAQQQFKDDCNLNSIMERFNATGEMSHFHNIAAQYGDFTHVTDYQTSLNTIIAAQATFDALPASLRKRFDNDPSQFVDFCSDEKNRDELRSLGLLKPEVIPGAGSASNSASPASGDNIPGAGASASPSPVSVRLKGKGDSKGDE